jgi:hypothetical protein
MFLLFLLIFVICSYRKINFGLFFFNIKIFLFQSNCCPKEGWRIIFGSFILPVMSQVIHTKSLNITKDVQKDVHVSRSLVHDNHNNRYAFRRTAQILRTPCTVNIFGIILFAVNSLSHLVQWRWSLLTQNDIRRLEYPMIPTPVDVHSQLFMGHMD